MQARPLDMGVAVFPSVLMLAPSFLIELDDGIGVARMSSGVSDSFGSRLSSSGSALAALQAATHALQPMQSVES